MSAAPMASCFDVIIDALESYGSTVRRRGDQFEAQCPAHDDRSPSLSVRYDRTNGTVLLNCHTGCSGDDIVAALGLGWGDLYDEPARDHRDRKRPARPERPVRQPQRPRQPTPRRELVCRYDYRDEHDVLRYQKERFRLPDAKPGERDKDFLMRRPRPDGSGRWTYELGDIRRLLYRLPDVLRAIKAGDPIVLVEGEKDADRVVEQLGTAATCNDDGAGGTWRPEYSEMLRGARLRIIADNDEPGIRHAWDVAAAVQGIAAEVRVFRGAVDQPKADISDHLDAGLQLKDLVPLLPADIDEQHDDGPPDVEEPSADEHDLDDQLISAIATKYEPLDWHAVFTADDLQPDWLIDDVIELGKSHAIFSPAKAGKSLLTLDMVASLATGRSRLGKPGREPITVLYVDIENSRSDLHRRLSAMAYTPDDLKRLVYLSFPDLPPLNTAEGGRHLHALTRHHDATIVVLDTVSRVVTGKENENDPFQDLYRFALSRLKRDGTTILRLDHAGKDLTRGPRGGSAKADDLDTIWLLQPRGGQRFTLKLERQRSGLHPDEVELVRRTDPLRHLVVAAGPVTPASCADPGIAALVNRADELGVPDDAGRERLRSAFAGAGVAARTDDLAAVVRVRKARAAAAGDVAGDDREPLWGAP